MPCDFIGDDLQQVLRQDMGFDGVIISDSMNMGAIVNHYTPVDAAVKAMQAGITMIMLSEEHYDHSDAYLDKQLAMIHGVIDAVEQGVLAESVIDQALEKSYVSNWKTGADGTVW